MQGIESNLWAIDRPLAKRSWDASTVKLARTMRAGIFLTASFDNHILTTPLIYVVGWRPVKTGHRLLAQARPHASESVKYLSDVPMLGCVISNPNDWRDKPWRAWSGVQFGRRRMSSSDALITRIHVSEGRPNSP
jgi:hypothetical protein